MVQRRARERGRGRPSRRSDRGRETAFKKCQQCGRVWRGFGSEPRAREICEGCGAYLHCCVNCHHFDSTSSYSCRLKESSFIGPRTALNYCDYFKMEDAVLKEAEARVDRARSRWEALFGN